MTLKVNIYIYIWIESNAQYIYNTVENVPVVVPVFLYVVAMLIFQIKRII